MKIYVSGISGTGMAPLALVAKKAGQEVVGSDLSAGPATPELDQNGIEYHLGPQDGEYLKAQHEKSKIDWFVYTSALPADAPELKLAKELQIKTTKRDEFLNAFIKDHNLKLVAIAGTHGKTTTTSMTIWAARELGLPVSYAVGTTLPFAPAGDYAPEDRYFIYEADEYDRNFLAFHPWLSAITVTTYDHPDIYPTKEDYKLAFRQFQSQSDTVIYGGVIDSRIRLAGPARREDATTALALVKEIAKNSQVFITEEKIIEILNRFPGTGRRFEKLKDGLYTDYAHHPEEIISTIDIAEEEARLTGKKGVVVLYEPHQNTRQHQVLPGYKNAFLKAARLYWLPTYLVREDPNLPVLTPSDFINTLANPSIATPAVLDQNLENIIKEALAQNYLVLLLTAGPADTWLRQILKS